MNPLYQSSFLKDIKALKSTQAFEFIKTLVFEEIPNTSSFEEIRNFKKLKGYEDAY